MLGETLVDLIKLGLIDQIDQADAKAQQALDDLANLGPGGTGLQAYTHNQASAATEWIINHNIGTKPTVTVFSVGGVEVMADVVHSTVNQARVYFNTPTAGSARCI